MLATVFSAVLFAVSFVPASNVDAATAAKPTCCAKHAYCCTINAACCGDRSSSQATVDDVATATSQPTCCAKRAYCCSIKAACCGKNAASANEPEASRLI